MLHDKYQGIGTLEFQGNSPDEQRWAQGVVEKFREMGCLYEPGRYSPTPLCFSKSGFEGMIDDVRSLLGLARKAAIDSGNILRWARDDQRDLVRQWLSQPLLPLMARPDAIVVDGHLKLLELNIDSGLGGYFEVELVQNALAEYNRRFLGGQFAVPTVMSSICRYLEDLAAPLGTSTWTVAVMIDGHLTAYNSSHAHFFAGYLNRHVSGTRAKVVYSADLYREGTKMRDREQAFDIIWRFGSMAHSPEALARSIAVQSAAFGAEVIMVCNPADVGVEGKLVLAYLSHHADTGSEVLSEEEAQLVRRLVPWTRIVGDADVGYQGQRHALPALATARKNEFVLKRAHSKSALQVYIGSEMSDQDWCARLADAVNDPIPWVLQQNVQSDKLRFDYMDSGGRITSVHQSYSVNPFIFGQAYAAPFIRIERDDSNRRLAIANVDAMAIGGVIINPDQ